MVLENFFPKPQRRCVTIGTAMDKNQTRVVIIGSGYAGVRVARDVARAARAHTPLEVWLVSKSSYHLDTPLLYEVASAYLSHESLFSSETVRDSVCVPLADIFAQLPVRLVQREVRSLVPQERLLVCSDGSTITYDILVLSVGARLATYGIPGVETFAFSVKTLHEALELRHHIVRHFHMAKKMSRQQRQRALTFVVVGAGAAGVETVAELTGQIAKQCDRLHIDRADASVVLVEAGPDILKTVAAQERPQVVERLKTRGVQLMLGQPIVRVAKDHVECQSGLKIFTHTVVWTGGLTAHPLLAGSTLPIEKWGVACESTLRVRGNSAIFAAGDCAVITPAAPPLPATVPVAYTEGALVARNILHQLRSEELESMNFTALGALIATGSKTALAVWPSGKGWFGFSPWLIKQLVTLRYWWGYLRPLPALRYWWRSVVLHALND